MIESVLDTVRVNYLDEKHFIEVLQVIEEPTDPDIFAETLGYEKKTEVTYRVRFSDRETGQHIDEKISLNIFKTLADTATHEWNLYHGVNSEAPN